ncbi:MAG: hypothetical protein Q9157_004415 [Trypethelium eluteriae]
MHAFLPCVLSCLLVSISALRYDPTEAPWNLNQNETATDPLDYYGSWDNHTYTPSPQNWRFPFYSFFLDRFVNGDATNDNANGTAWEQDPTGTQLRAGGDITGLLDSIDYIHGLGIRGIYVAGSLFMNLPWESDSYSPVDHTLLDHHLGNITQWQETIAALHARGMYIILDNTMSTMSDLIGFVGHLNDTAPFSFSEYDTIWKSSRHYSDWSPSNNWEPECSYPYPRFWDQGGHLINDNNTQAMVGCMDSEFDQYGDVTAFGTYTEWQKELSKFNFAQDRLREWRPSVREKLEHFSCMIISALDIDGFRMDKALQITVDAQGNFSAAMRECGRQHGKNNFFIAGEVVNGNANGAIYLGRGKEPSMAFTSVGEAYTTVNVSNATDYVRDPGQNALDAAAFHYSTYRGLMRFLGLDGDLLAADDTPVNFFDSWNQIVLTNDLLNPNTGTFDPRHMYGVSNQDVFRWPGMTNGTQRQMLGAFVTTLEMPGIPLMSWGEEQAFYTLDSTAANYLYGRQFMASAQAWQMHGCYKVGDGNLNNAPLNSSLSACEDDSVSLDHRDPSHPVHNFYKSLFERRTQYPVLNDGWVLLELSKQTFNYTLPGSFGVPTETGIWSAVRTLYNESQDFTGIGQGNQSVWLVSSNQNQSRTFEFDCSHNDTALIAPFPEGTTVKNLIYPYDEWTLQQSPQQLGLNGSTDFNGCLPSMNMTLYGFKAFVPIDTWVPSSPVITKVSPGHDQRILSNVSSTEQDTVPIELRFSELMDCDSVRNSLSLSSDVEDGSTAQLDRNSINCLTTLDVDAPPFYGTVPTAWTFTANLVNVSNGVHTITMNNATTQGKNSSTKSVDHFMFRIGQSDNPMVFPTSANYSSTLLFQGGNTKRDSTIGSGSYIAHKAAGANSFRYSTNWGSSWSDWMPYTGGNTTVQDQTWSGTKAQEWSGQHVRVQYWSKTTGSSNHIQEGDLSGSNSPPRRFPHIWLHGPWNQFGYDAGVENTMKQDTEGKWNLDFLTEWPAQFQVNVWGMNPDGSPDQTHAYGDVDNDTILDRIPPLSLQESMVNITDHGPPSPHLAYRIQVDDGSMRVLLIPVGSRWVQLAIWILFAIVPVLMACLAVWLYLRIFCQVKFNQVGLTNPKPFLPAPLAYAFSSKKGMSEKVEEITPPSPTDIIRPTTQHGDIGATVRKRTVLIGTIEYDIEDWKIKVKIGGLGVMAQLMGKHLAHQNLVWVVPCVGDIDYPEDERTDPFIVTIMGKAYEVQVQFHFLNNITYVLLDAPIFRKQTKAEPYPPRMDDLESAIYYSAWNQCIAQAMTRFHIDLYHINDYHGTIAPLYHLPEKLPCCLSLHNAEFQGLWPMRSAKERQEICSVFNLDEDIVQRYVQFGEIFNLLHAGASILRINQSGFGAVGVSKKYGKRSFARYPIFWGLKRVGALPNPDPSDLEQWDKQHVDPNSVTVDKAFEAGRPELKRQAQEWAGLEQREDADLFVFVGRWSMQKGIDLIADVFPAILEQHPHVQLLCVGPVIDLYGKFAALKLDVMMKKYPGRVYSKPEFTALPPFIFSGADFALIPSRDEPFGLVAVEFGRKGALGVGARVGGLGQVPGWWFTIESMSTKHLLRQFKMAIRGALASNTDLRAIMRARSAKQRFPVSQWKEDLEILQATSIKAFQKRETKRMTGWSTPGTPRSGWQTPRDASQLASGYQTPRSGWQTPRMISPRNSAPTTRESSPTREGSSTNDSPLAYSLGRKMGPGHSIPRNASLRSLASGVFPSAFPNQSGRIHAVMEDPTAEQQAASSNPDEYILSAEQAEASKRQSYMNMEFLRHDPYATRRLSDVDEQSGGISVPHPALARHPPASAFVPPLTLPESNSSTPTPGTPREPTLAQLDPIRGKDLKLSLETVLNEKENKEPQDLLPFFTDPTGLYYRTFETKLGHLSGKTSEGPLCIEEYLAKSEKTWFNRLHDARMSKPNSRVASPAGSIFNEPVGTSSSSNSPSHNTGNEDEDFGQFLLPSNYKPPTGVKRFLSTKIGDWPIYAFLLALGQILAANSYQITLLTGQVGEPAAELYTIACIYLGASVLWWAVFRSLKSTYVLGLPWFFYGGAFFLLGVAPYGATYAARGWVQNVAKGFYAVASASGSFFFAQNFGSLGTAPVKTWGFRACVIQGTQQIYIVALWAWGSKLANIQGSGTGATTSLSSAAVTGITVPIAILLWVIGVALFTGLPDYYRQAPGAVPSFYKGLLRRKIILWFFVAVFIQNFWLSSLYGRNWGYLWSSKWAPTWAVIVLVIFFFIIVWAALLYLFSHLSTVYTWILPIFAVGLGAPRWCQMLWATSNIGFYLPWAGGPVASALLGRGLWLWLGVLDSLQGVGFGMILLQTLTRFHITFTLIAAQIIGSVGTIISRAAAPNAIGPATVFPSFAGGVSDGLSQPWFWVALLFQAAVSVGFLVFFRKEQLSKP